MRNEEMYHYSFPLDVLEEEAKYQEQLWQHQPYLKSMPSNAD